MIADETTARVLTNVADGVERAGGRVLEQLPDGRYLLLIVADSQPDGGAS